MDDDLARDHEVWRGHARPRTVGGGAFDPGGRGSATGAVGGRAHYLGYSMGHGSASTCPGPPPAGRLPVLISGTAGIEDPTSASIAAVPTEPWLTLDPTQATDPPSP